jgi:hypothetical protein
MNQCFKCGSTENLREVVAYPGNNEEPDVLDDICSDCEKKFSEQAEDDDSVLLSCPHCQEQLQPSQLATHFRSHED